MCRQRRIIEFRRNVMDAGLPFTIFPSLSPTTTVAPQTHIVGPLQSASVTLRETPLPSTTAPTTAQGTTSVPSPGTIAPTSSDPDISFPSITTPTDTRDSSPTEVSSEFDLPSSSDVNAVDSTPIFDQTTTETATAVVPVTSYISITGSTQATTVWLSGTTAVPNPSAAPSDSTAPVEKIVIVVACVCPVTLVLLICWMWKKRRRTKRDAVINDAPHVLSHQEPQRTFTVDNGELPSPIGSPFPSMGANAIGDTQGEKPREFDEHATPPLRRSSSTLSYINSLAPEPTSLNTMPPSQPQPALSPCSMPPTSLAPYQRVGFRPLPMPAQLPPSGRTPFSGPEDRGSVWSVMEVSDARSTFHDAYGGIGGEVDMDLPPIYSRY
ncbi:hypothetical protein BV20DRAFT_1126047 [Pilatotrama ljubarskyi]|nr:hypothetical protein BV20DRAFT_1126047 [Pilatotrama ljubarskyi]